MEQQSKYPLYLYTGRGEPGSKMFFRRLKEFLPETVSLQGEWIGIGKAVHWQGSTPLKMNGGAKAFAALDEGSDMRKTAQILRASGLLPPGWKQGEDKSANSGANSGFYRRFELTVFHLQAVDIVETGFQPPGVVHAEAAGNSRQAGIPLAGPEPGGRFYRRLEKLAVRALYAFGLDFGEVTMESAGGGFTVSGIKPLPPLRRPEAAASFAAAVMQTANEWAAAAAPGGALALPHARAWAEDKGAPSMNKSNTSNVGFSSIYAHIPDAADVPNAAKAANAANTANAAATADAANAANARSISSISSALNIRSASSRSSASSARSAVGSQPPLVKAAIAANPPAQELLIGMDPEFLLFDQSRSKIIPASRYFARAGIAGCDAVWIAGRPRFPLAELRPGPAAAPREAIRRLMGAMREADRQVADKSLAWLAGGQPQQGLPLGGHLHFSGVPLTARLLRALDSYLALPVLMLEPAGSRARRPRYGRLGDFRRQSHGGFEYRTLPSFLVSPLVAKGVVALALLIAEEAGRLPDSGLPLSGSGPIAAFYKGDRHRLRDSALRAVREIETWAGYAKYRSYIDPLFKAVRSGETWDETKDIRTAWKIAAYPSARPAFETHSSR